MALGNVVLELVVVVTTMVVTASLVIVGPRPIVRAFADARFRIGTVVLPAAALVSVLAVRWGTSDVFHELTWRVVGTNITPLIYDLEATVFPSNPVVVLQSFQSPTLTTLSVFIYIYGYAFLLVFPAVAYFALEDDRMESLSSLLLAFAVNYAIGLVLYVLFIAYGPRNYDPMFEGLLYLNYPEYSHLTHTVNQNINVFPSLHTSMAITVFLFAWLTRRKYPLWTAIAGVLAGSVALSTMYLGIHWFTDVVAGALLATVSVYVGVNYTADELLRGFSQAAGSVQDRALGVTVTALERSREFVVAKLDRADDDHGESPRGE